MDKKQTPNLFLAVFAVFIISLSFVYFFAITFMNMPETGARYADIILGALIGSGFTAILSYFYGSSKGSSDKSIAIRGMEKRKSDESGLPQ